VPLYQVGRERREPFDATVGVSALDLQVPALAVAEFMQNVDEVALHHRCLEAEAWPDCAAQVDRPSPPTAPRRPAAFPPAPDRPSSWRTFLRDHWGAIDFFTTEVWTPRGLITYYTLFVIDLRSRRVYVAGSTPTPDAWFMAQAARRLTDAVDGFLVGYQILICDRDRKWTHGFRHILQGAGVRIVLTLVQAQNANAYEERFVRSIREECLDRLIFFGERRCSAPSTSSWRHYHGERSHQGLGNELIIRETRPLWATQVRCRERLGGLLRYYHRAA
jgi:putative transposase